MTWGDKKKEEPKTGLEMGLRLAMKMAGVNSDEVFAQVKRFVEDGTLERIVAFADAIEFNNFLMGTIYNEQRKLHPDMPDLASAFAAFKSRTSGGNGGHGEPAAPRLIVVSGTDTSV